MGQSFFSVSQARAGDARFLAAMELPHPPGNAEDPHHEQRLYRQEVWKQQLLAEDGLEVAVARSDGGYLGFIAVRRAADEARIEALEVSKRHRNSNVEARLLEYAGVELETVASPESQLLTDTA